MMQFLQDVFQLEVAIKLPQVSPERRIFFNVTNKFQQKYCVLKVKIKKTFLVRWFFKNVYSYIWKKIF